MKKLRFVDDDKALKNALETLKKALLKADVHHRVVKELLGRIEEEVKAKGIGQGNFLAAIKTQLEGILSVRGGAGGGGGQTGERAAAGERAATGSAGQGGEKSGAGSGAGTGSAFTFAANPPTVVLMVGLQGGGKTTSTVKLANYLKLRNKRILIAACDLQRLAATEQLGQLCEANELELFALENEKDPVRVATAALKRAREILADALLIDTAGRLAVDENLMDELARIKAATAPHEIFYVADAMSGQDGLRTAGAFHERVGLSGVVLSKFDADTKGGVALGIAYQLGIALRFIGTGERAGDLEPFVPERITSRIMGEGDLATLAEKTAALVDEATAKRLNQKIKKGEFNFDDFLAQLGSVQKMGSVKSLLGMIPGMSGVANSLGDLDLEKSKELIHIKAMISSMTPRERSEPSLLNNARKRRIAAGAGLGIEQVNRFIKQFENVARMAKKFSNKRGMESLMNMMSQARRGF